MPWLSGDTPKHGFPPYLGSPPMMPVCGHPTAEHPRLGGVFRRAVEQCWAHSSLKNAVAAVVHQLLARLQKAGAMAYFNSVPKRGGAV